MKIQVLGSGCSTCKALHKAVEEVVEKLKLDETVEYSTDITKIVELGAMGSPVFAVCGDVISVGKVPSSKEIEAALLSKKDGCCADKNVSSTECASKEDSTGKTSCCG